MEIERTADMLHPELKDGRVDLQVYISDLCSNDVQPAIDAWGKGEKEVVIATHFNLSTALDNAISLNCMPAHGNAIHEDAKPLFNSMRAELAYMIARIDALTFKNPDNESV